MADADADPSSGAGLLLLALPASISPTPLNSASKWYPAQPPPFEETRTNAHRNHAKTAEHDHACAQTRTYSDISRRDGRKMGMLEVGGPCGAGIE